MKVIRLEELFNTVTNKMEYIIEISSDEKPDLKLGECEIKQ